MLNNGDTHHHHYHASAQPDPVSQRTALVLLESMVAVIRGQHLLYNQMQDLLTMNAALQTEINDLTAAVARLTAAEDSALTLIRGFAAQLEAARQAALEAGASPEQLQALHDLHTAVDSEASELAAAVVASTPVEPAPATEAGVDPEPAPAGDPAPDVVADPEPAA
jgi:hypothetical protein